MKECGIEIRIKITFVQNLAVFACRYIKSKWLLNQLCKLTIAKIYCNGKLTETLTLGDILK